MFSLFFVLLRAAGENFDTFQVPKVRITLIFEHSDAGILSNSRNRPQNKVGQVKVGQNRFQKFKVGQPSCPTLIKVGQGYYGLYELSQCKEQVPVANSKY